MAQKPIREYDVKLLIALQWQKYYGETNLQYQFKTYLIDATDMPSVEKIKSTTPWISQSNLVAKPDELFGKRGKNGLVLVDKNLQDSMQWIENNSYHTTTLLSGVSGTLRYFVIEEFVAHDSISEYYVSFEIALDANIVHISKFGGVDIEENWDQSVDTIRLGLLEENGLLKIQLLTLGYSEAHTDFITQMYKLFCDQDFAYLEFNPYIIKDNTVYLLDCVAKLDDTAQFLHVDEWKGIDFPKSFGSLAYTAEESLVESLDSKSGASLKLRMLNQRGDIYPLFSGGGASIAMMDLITVQMGSEHIALYGEYSGNPTQEETKQYTQAVLDLMVTNNPEHEPRILLIVGAVANFTDIYKTFLGIVDALKQNIESLNLFPLTIVVRRGGPNAAKALTLIAETCSQLGLPYKAYTHSTQLHEVVQTLPNYL